MLKIYFILIVLFTLTNCSSPTSRNESTTKTDSLNRDDIETTTIKEREKDYNYDTLKVEGKVVVFFTISQQEYDLLPKDPNSGVDEVLDDFNYHAGIASDSMKRTGYETTITGSRYIQVKLDNGNFKTFDRLASQESIVGYLFSDGVKEPKIEYGVGTDLDLLSSFNDFKKKED